MKHLTYILACIIIWTFFVIWFSVLIFGGEVGLPAWMLAVVFVSVVRLLVVDDSI